MVNRARPTHNKRERERAKQDPQEKAARRAEAKARRASTPRRQPGEDPDLAGIVPGPQPSPWPTSSTTTRTGSGVVSLTTMKIGILTNEFPPYIYGGAGVHVEYLTASCPVSTAARTRCGPVFRRPVGARARPGGGRGGAPRPDRGARPRT